MAAEKVRGGFKFICDCCGEVWEPPKFAAGSTEFDFTESLETAKDDGWRAVQVRSKIPGKMNWEHRCKECV